MTAANTGHDIVVSCLDSNQKIGYINVLKKWMKLVIGKVAESN